MGRRPVPRVPAPPIKVVDVEGLSAKFKNPQAAVRKAMANVEEKFRTGQPVVEEAHITQYISAIESAGIGSHEYLDAALLSVQRLRVHQEL